MKIASTLKLIAPLAVALSAPAIAGIDTSIFTTADVDLSGSLSTQEFTTTLEAGLSVKAINKRFRFADANRNGGVQLSEFLVFDGTLTFTSKTERQFLLGDASINGSLDFDEFVSISGRKASFTSIRRSWLRADVDASGSLTLAEYVNFRRGQTPQPADPFTIFELTDFNNNGEITVAEFGNFYKQGASAVKVGAKFAKLDQDGNGILTTAEWNPGVRSN